MTINTSTLLNYSRKVYAAKIYVHDKNFSIAY